MIKKQFETWIKKQYPEKISRPDRYSNTINAISNHLKKKNIENYNLFKIQNSKTAILLREMYFSFSEYYEQNKRGNSMYSRAFDLYIEYLKANEQLGGVSENQHVVIQPIGSRNSIDNFLAENSTRWAESKRHKKQWAQSRNAIVLFTKDGKVFAKATIAKIDNSEQPDHPLDYYYNDLTLVENIDYQRIVDLAEHPLKGFRNFELLNAEKSAQIIRYIKSVETVYLDDQQADYEFQNEVDTIDSKEPEEQPQERKQAKEVNGRKVYPRNFTYTKKALENANYKCEVDAKHKTFVSKSSDKQYVEAHHLIALKFQEEFEYSLDVSANIVALCPICHRKIHHGLLEDKEKLFTFLLKIKKNKLEKFGINIDGDELQLYC